MGEHVRRPSRRVAAKAYAEREAKRRLAEVWNQPKPGSWFDRMVGRVAKKRKETEK